MERRARAALLLAACLWPARAGAIDITGVAVTDITTGSLTVGWTIPATATPTIVFSTNNFSSIISSAAGTLAQNSKTFLNLTPNTTYWFKIKNSTNGDSDYTSFNAGQSTSTLATSPAAAAFSGVTVSTIQANWTANSNGAGVRYEAVLSSGALPRTNGFSGNITSSRTLSTSFVFYGTLGTALAWNTTYYVEVLAYNNNGVAGTTVTMTTATLANVPVSSPTVSVTSTQITAAWGISSNPPETRYVVFAATESTFTTPRGSSDTAGTSATISGLAPNTTYFLQVQALNFRGGASTFAALGSTSTLADVPTASSFTAVTISTIQANWTGSNGPGTRYTAILSSGASPSSNGFAGNASSTTGNSYAVFFTGLSVNTTYFVEVQAIGNAGQTTAFASLGSTPTLANVPASSAPTSVAAQSLTANWGISSNPPGTRYQAQISAASNFSTVLASSDTANTFASFSGLSANTTYFTQVRALNFSGGASTFTALPSTSTLAAVPAAAAFDQVGVSSIQANWTANGSGAGVIYQAVLSTGASPSTNGFAANQSSTTLNASAVFSGLSVNTTYFVEVRAVNNNGVATAYADLGSTATLANPPGFAGGPTVETTSVTAAWALNGNPAGTRFLAEISADSAFSPVLASSNTANLSAAFLGLASNTTFYLRVKSLSFSGGSSTYTALTTTSTLSAAPASAPFGGVFVSSIQVVWSANGNRDGTVYEAVLSTGPNPSSNGFAGNSSGTVTSTSTVFAGLIVTTTYYAAVRSRGNAGGRSAYVDLGSTRTAASEEAFSPGQTQAIVLNSAVGEIRIDLPAQAFSQAVAVSASVPASFPEPSGELRGIGAGVEITLSPPVQPTREVDLSIGYTETAGFDEAKLIIARYDPSRGVWVPLISRADPGSNKVTARVNHFSLFQVMQASVGGDLSQVKAFPNPLRPNRGQAAMTFIRLPAGARLRVYSYLGQLIRDLTADGAGMASWNGKSDAGLPAASGVYVVLIEGGGARRTFKVAVER